MHNVIAVTADLSQHDMFVIVSIIVVGLLLQTLLIFAFVRFNIANLEYRMLTDENQRLKAELKEIEDD